MGAPSPELALRAPLFLLSRELPAICPSPGTPHLLGPESRKTRPLPLIPLVRTAQPHAAPPPKSALSLLPTSPNPGQLRGRRACTSLLEGRGLMSAPFPPLGPFSARGSGFTHGCPELLRFARAGSRRSRLACPSPAHRGGRREGARGGARLHARPHCPELPSPLSGGRSPRSPSHHSPLQPGVSRPSVLGTVRRERFRTGVKCSAFFGFASAGEVLTAAQTPP